MRSGKACLQCREGKRRCDRQNLGACEQCIQRNLQCSAKVDTNHENDESAASNEPVTSLPLLPSYDSTTLHLVDLYFRFIHDKPHSIFHEPSFKASVADRSVSSTVLQSMIGLSARFAEDADVRARGPSYVAEAKRALREEMEHICIENIQACILVGNVCMGDSQPNTASLYLVLANRMAQILKIWVMEPTDDGVTRELKLRIWWSCFIIDTWASGGSNLSRQVMSHLRKPQVPMDETTFSAMRLGDPVIPDHEWRPGLWGYMVNLVEIYSWIQDLHKQLAEAIDWDEQWIQASVADLERKLISFQQNLPLEMIFSIENLARHAQRGLGRTFVAFHLGYHHYCTLLFYLYLDRRRPPTTNGREYGENCKAHAKAVCDILKASREMEGCEALYSIVGHVTVVSSSVLLHTYLFGDVGDLPDAKARLESNLESLVLLRGYWISVELMIQRLVIFQSSCLRSVTKNTHRFDRWMVKFLIEHATELEEKTDDSPPTWDLNAMTGHIQIERSQITQSLIEDLAGMDQST